MQILPKEEAIQQIRDNKYYEKYELMKKNIYLVGVEFEEKNISGYLIEEFERC